MNKDLHALYSKKKGGHINQNECARINMVLSTTNIDDIPEDQLENVKDYLIHSLNMNSVKPSLVKDLDELLELLQKV